ncbi:MAG: FAD/NAD(P)-binding oxidoreductase [Candidatus Sedimenticola sp. (ex Thyasira tokunagai)]
MSTYFIIGSGVAGRRAAEAIRERDANGAIIMAEAQESALYTRPMLGEMLAKGSVSSAATQHKLKELGVQFQSGISAKEVRLSSQQVLLSNKRLVTYDKLLVTTGKRTARAFFDDDQTDGIVHLDHLPDLQQIESRIKSTRKAVVYGDNFQAVSAVYGLQRRGIHCTLVLPKARLYPGYLDVIADEIMETRLRQAGAEVIRSADVQLVEKDGSTLSGVVISGGRKLAADLLVLSAVQAPSLDFFGDSILGSAHGVEVATNQCSRESNIYAAGDVALIATEGVGDSGALRGWLRAWKQGHIAGANMAGDSLVYEGTPSLRTKVLDLDLVCLGESNTIGDNVLHESGDYPYAELPYVYKKLVFRDDKIIGAIFVGDVSEAGEVEQWIRKGLNRRECDPRIINQMFALQFRKPVAHSVLCPVCKYQMQHSEKEEEGAITTCPACGIDFQIERQSNNAYRAVPVD